MEKITARSNPLLQHMKKLAADGAYRRQRGLFLGDSPKLLEEAVRWGGEIVEVVLAEGVTVPALPRGVRVVEVPRDVMTSVSPMKTPQGALFTCRIPQAAVPEKLTGRRYVVLDGVQDPGNVGTILRTLDAFDFDGLILLEGCADAWSIKTVRASMGAVFRRDIYTMTAEACFALLRRSDLPLYGTALREDTVDARHADLSRCAIAIGSEGRGLREVVLANCEKTLKIPMSQRCESLNAAVAAAVLLWESYRND
ncbi:MAG: RNA methyltransferase [Oscillospiraceae bacterium]|nr:RNA methyltransferase [Oscillospiraceae bacterium]